MSMEEIIKRNTEKMRKDLKILINYKDKILFFMLNIKYNIDDLEYMDITGNKIDVIIKNEKKTYLIDKNFFSIVRKMKILIVEEKEVLYELKKRPEITERLLDIKQKIEKKELMSEKENLSSATDKIEKELFQKLGEDKLKLNFKFKEYFFDDKI